MSVQVLNHHKFELNHSYEIGVPVCSKPFPIKWCADEKNFTIYFVEYTSNDMEVVRRTSCSVYKDRNSKMAAISIPINRLDVRTLQPDEKVSEIPNLSLKVEYDDTVDCAYIDLCTENKAQRNSGRISDTLIFDTIESKVVGVEILFCSLSCTYE